MMLTDNHRVEGPCGEIFNQLFYNGQLKFWKTTRTKNPQYEAMTDFLWWFGHEFEQQTTPDLDEDGGPRAGDHTRVRLRLSIVHLNRARSEHS